MKTPVGSDRDGMMEGVQSAGKNSLAGRKITGHEPEGWGLKWWRILQTSIFTLSLRKWYIIKG